MRRDRFFFNLGAIGVACLLIVASVAFGPDAVSGVGLGIGIATWLASLWFIAVRRHRRQYGRQELRLRRRRVDAWATLTGAMVGVTAWETVQAAVFAPTVSRWLTLANGLLLALFGCTGLVMHEVSVERVVYVLEVIERTD